MGHKRKNLKMQINDRLQAALRLGMSKHEAKKDGTAASGIYSKQTFKTYKQQAYIFAAWLKENRPEVKTLEDARQYVGAWLESQVARGLSPYTLKTAASALGKVYGCNINDFGIKLPARNRENITRSRNRVKRDAGFSEAQNADLVSFLRSTGLRRAEAEGIRGTWLRIDENGNAFISLDNPNVAKGGKYRLIPVLGDVDVVVRMCQEAGEGKVFAGGINSHCDVHSYRAEYCARAYASVARDVKTLERAERYHCRGRSVVYDREALRYASRCLGHERAEIIPSHYLHTLDK